MKALRLTVDEKYAVAEALDYHYLAGDVDEVGAVGGYGVTPEELSDEERATRDSLRSALGKVRAVLDDSERTS